MVPSIYLQEYFYTTTLGYVLEYRVLSYKELDNIQNKYSKLNNQYPIIIVKTALLNNDYFSLLSQEDINILFNKIMEASNLTPELVSKIEFSVQVVLEENFKDETFKDCKVCQSRKLDKARNCPMLDSSTYDKGVFYIIGGKKIEICPMEAVNSPLIGNAFRAYNLYDKGLLPESGGLYDQTSFFVEISSMVSGIISAHQAKELSKK